MEFTASTVAFIVMIVAGIVVAVLGKWRLNTMVLTLGVILALAGIYCLFSGMFSF